MSYSAYRPNRRDESLWPPLVRTDRSPNGNRCEGLDPNTTDSEDELEPMKESYGNDHPLRRHQSFQSEDDVVDYYSNTATGGGGGGGGVKDRLHGHALARSWIRLESAPYVHFKQQPQGSGGGGKDKWHEWFQMQKDWLSNVEQDPDNYFDDNL